MTEDKGLRSHSMGSKKSWEITITWTGRHDGYLVKQI